MDIPDRTALVTGGSAGIGRTIARRLLREGAHVVVADRNRPEDRGVEFLEVDVTDRASVERMIRISQPTILVNNAGGFTEPVFPDAPLEHSEQLMELNLGSVLRAIHFVVPVMEREGGGAIVNIASSAGVGLGAYPSPEYATAKAAVIRLTASLAALGERGIRVVCISPHTVATPAVLARIDELRRAGESLPADLAVDLIDPEKVAEVAVTLIRDDGSAARVVFLGPEEGE